jgi:hypothetical protein
MPISSQSRQISAMRQARWFEARKCRILPCPIRSAMARTVSAGGVA